MNVAARALKIRQPARRTVCQINSIHKPPVLPVRIEKVLPLQREHLSLYQPMSMPVAYEWMLLIIWIRRMEVSCESSEWTTPIISALFKYTFMPKIRIFCPAVFLFQQKGLDPLLKHHILYFIIIVFKHDVVTDEFF